MQLAEWTGFWSDGRASQSPPAGVPGLRPTAMIPLLRHVPRALFAAAAFALAAASLSAGNYQNFSVAVYLPVGTANPATVEAEWTRISGQLKVDKVYIEAYRSRRARTDQDLETLKKFFLERGVKVAGGVTLAHNDSNQFQSFTFTDSADRAYCQSMVELAARHFDEIILDDFFFVTTKFDSDIAAKGAKSWTQFRLELMDDVARNLVVGPAKAVNPKCRLIVKFPNWYEHFQALGYDLDAEPKIFDGIYTGTETRDPDVTDQNLQQYESHLIFRYFENIAPGRNGGGWVDTGSLRYLDRYAEQLWNTAFAKPPEVMLFNWNSMLQGINAGDRAAWATLPTSFNYDAMLKSGPPAAVAPATDPAAPAPAAGPGPRGGRNATGPTMALVAGYALKQVDAFLGQLGRPVGIKSYKPYQSTGEDFLHCYLGNLGLPVDLVPAYPADASVVLLTECAKADPDIVKKMKASLQAGHNVVITSGLGRALAGHGLEDIVELEWSDRKFVAKSYTGGFGAGNATVLSGDIASDQQVLFPQIRFMTNDSWALVRGVADGKGFPILLMNRYGKGVLYVLDIPDNFNDLYNLPPAVLNAIKAAVTGDFFVGVDGPAKVALYAYDNSTFIVESYLPTPTEVRVNVAGAVTLLRNLETKEAVSPQPAGGRGARGGRGGGNRGGAGGPAPRTSFTVQLAPHSYQAFAIER